MSTLHSEPRSANAQEARSPASEGIRHWLVTSAEALDAPTALVLVRQGSRGFVFAAHPESRSPDPELSEVAQGAIRDGFKIERNSHSPDDNGVVVGLRSRLGGRPAAIVFRLRVPPGENDDALISRVRRAALRRDDDETHSVQMLPMGSVATLINPTLDPVNLPQTEPDTLPSEHPLIEQVERQGTAIETVAVILDEHDKEQASRAFVDALARRFSCHRVSLALAESSKTKLIATSGTSRAEKNADRNVHAMLALEETVLFAIPVAMPAVDPRQMIPPNHRAYLDAAECGAVLSLPLISAGDVVGGVLLERDQAFAQADVDQLTELCLLAAPILRLKEEAASGVLVRALRSSKQIMGRVFGPARLGLKLGAICVFVALFASTQITKTFNVDADASIEATVHRAVVAGSNGYVSEVEKRAGDVVLRGDVLARLDVEELQLELIKWRGERDKLSKEQRAVLAQRDRSRIRVLSAKYAQAQAQIEFLEAQVSRAVMRSPIDGVVVSGDLTEALGSPVERGQLLYEVASLDGYRLILMVNETDIGVVTEGLNGKLRLKSGPSNVHNFTVTRITPVAHAGDGVNRFRLEAEFVGGAPNVRPGMEGVAKISAGERSLAWIWSRSFVDWMRLQAWKWGGL